MGVFRYYLTPVGLLKLEELPKGWGLLESDGGPARVVLKATFIERTNEVAAQEQTLLLSVVRRLQSGHTYNKKTARFRAPK